MKKPKPHVSAALAHLRPGVTCASMVVALCAVIQLLVFGFVHFTEIRYEAPSTKTTDTATQPLSVVPAVKIEPRRETLPGGTGTVSTEPAPAPPPELRPLSQFDLVLRHTSDTAAAVGVASAAALWMLIFLGVVIGAAASVPGVEKAVSACTWAMVLAVVCLPWRYLVPTAPFPGVFSSYAAMVDSTAAVDAGRASTGALLGTYLVLPAAALVVGFMVLARFRDGIAAGVIVQSVSELDLAIEREAGEIARRGISVSGPRAVGALNAAMGATEDLDHDPPPPRRAVREADPAPAMPARTADGMARPAPARERRFQVEDDEDGYRRPI